MSTKVCYPKSFKSDKYPKFIRNSIYLKAYPNPDKIFPKIGLPNCSVSLNSVKFSEKQQYKDLLARIAKVFRDISNQWYKTYPYTSTKASKKEVRNIYDDISKFESALYDDISYENYKDSIAESKQGYQLSLPKKTSSYYGSKLTFSCFKVAEDRDLITVVKQFQKYAKDNKIKGCAELEKLSFELNTKPQFITDLKSKKDLTLHFSSDGQQGYWDIATMAMRGISSCQSWKGGHSSHLIGSIIDPYTGIVYITDNSTTNYGKTMIARAVVRFITDNKNKPHLLLEPVYFGSKVRNNIDAFELTFASFLEQKTKLPVITSDKDNDGFYDCDYYIPKTEPITAVMDSEGLDKYCDYDSHTLSYRDSGIPYKENKKFFEPKKAAKTVKNLTKQL